MTKNHALPVNGTTSDGLAVAINEVELGYLTQLAGWEDFQEKGNETLRAQGLSLPVDYHSSFRRGSTTIWRVAPDRMLLRSSAAFDFESAIDLAVLDLSHSRVCLTLEGPGANGLLSRVAPLDFSEVSFPVGDFAQTAIHHVSALIDRHTIDGFTLLIPTTFARSLTSFLTHHLTAESSTN
jgi:heterotetrameric sarcosine oxidase gamma subunit